MTLLSWQGLTSDAGWQSVRDNKEALSAASLLCYLPSNRKVRMRCFQWHPCCQTSGQCPVFSTQPLSPTMPGTVAYFEILLPLAFGGQQCPASSLILVTFFFTGSLLPSECWRTWALAHFLSLGSFPCLSFLFPCVYPFSIFVHSQVMMLALKREPERPDNCYQWQHVTPGNSEAQATGPWHQKIQAGVGTESWLPNTQIESTV